MGADTPFTPEQISKRRTRHRKEALFIALMLAPYLVLLLMFGFAPVIYALSLSFLDTIEWVFWGFANYALVLEDFRLVDAILNVLYFVSIWLMIMVISVAALSLILDAIPARPATILRTSFFLPGAITSSAIVVVWLFLLDPTVSPYAPLFDVAGLETRANVVSLFGYPLVFGLMAFLAHSGGWIVVMGGALKGISTEVLEAARVDGATPVQTALQIKLPLIWRSLALMAILTFSSGIQMFVEPQLMALAGSQYAREDWSVNQLAFQYAFTLGDFGASAALSVLLLLVALSISFLVIFGTKFYRTD